MSHKVIKLFIFLVLAIGITLALYFLRHQFEYQQFIATIQQFGMWGPVVFIALYIIATVSFLPGAIITIAGGFLFGAINGTIYNIIGALIGETIAFIIARYFGSNWVAKKSHGQLKRILNGVNTSGWQFVAILRIMPLIPFNLLNYTLGLTRIPLMQYVIASAIFMLPGTFAYTYLGSLGNAALTQDLKNLVTQILIAVGLLVALTLLPWIIKQWKQTNHEEG